MCEWKAPARGIREKIENRKNLKLLSLFFFFVTFLKCRPCLTVFVLRKLH